MIYQTHSAKQTQNLAKKLAAKYLKRGGVIALIGPLGAGKTTFTQGFAQGLGIKDRIISPTFILIRQHPIPKTTHIFYHIDLYRLEEESEINQLGLEELLTSQNRVVLIEWAEKIERHLPKNTVKIYFEPVSENTRKITIVS